MKDIITPLLNGLKSPFIGSQAPESPHGDSKFPFANIKSPLLGRKVSLGNMKSPSLAHKVSFSLIEGLKTPLLGLAVAAKAAAKVAVEVAAEVAAEVSAKAAAKSPTGVLSKDPDSSPDNTVSWLSRLPRLLRSTLLRNKDSNVTTTPAPAPIPDPDPVPDRLHIPPYNHQVDRELGYYDRGSLFDAFMSSFPNMPEGYRYIATNSMLDFGEPHLLGFPVKVRFRIYQYITISILSEDKKVVLSPGRTVNGFWPKNYFIEPEAVFDIIGSLSLTCFQLRHEVLTYYCSQFHFHITYNYFCTPIAAPLVHKWLPLFANKMQYLTVEVDFTLMGGSYENEKCSLTDGQREILWFIRKLVLALRDRSGTIRSLHVICRRYKGFRSPSQQKIPEKAIQEKKIQEKKDRAIKDQEKNVEVENIYEENTEEENISNGCMLLFHIPKEIANIGQLGLLRMGLR